ncbi:MAG: response regulator [Pseudomonadota bacterium]
MKQNFPDLSNTIGSICKTPHIVRPDEPVGNIKEIFDTNTPISAVVVTQGSSISGLVMNIHLNSILSHQYGFSLFYKKLVSEIMDTHPMIVDAAQNIEQVAQAAMKRENSRLYDHIIVTKNNLLFGIVAVRTILNALVESQKALADIQKRYTAKLEQEDAQRQIAIQELQESKKMLQLVIDAIPHAIFWKDRNSIYLGCNRTFADDAGVLQTEDIKGLTDDHLPWTHKEVMLFKNQDQRVMENNQPENHRRQVQTNSKGEKRFLETSKRPLHDRSGNVVGVLCFYQNITRQLQADNERLQLEKQLGQAQKMEAIGRLAGGVAHDLNNILSGIINYPELIMMDLPDDSKLIPSLKTIQASGERAAAIVQDLLTLARRGVMKKDRLDLNVIVQEYLVSPECLALKAEHSNVKIRKQINPHLLPIEGSKVHLMKTLMNLTNNAAEAIQGTGEVLISTRNQYVDQPLQGYDSVNEGDYVVLSVSDNGIGILKENMEKIFEPFYTCKKMGKSGSGLGMSVVCGTIKDHNGYIDISSQPEKGTSVTLYFPAMRNRIELVSDDVVQEDLMGQKQSILVVDDIPEQREIAASYLKRLNYQVHTLESGEHAMEYMKSNSADLLILDMIMEPGMDGLETYMKILEINPDQPAIIVSGYSESDRVKKAQMLGAGSYLRKPYNFINLGRAVKNELQRVG